MEEQTFGAVTNSLALDVSEEGWKSAQNPSEEVKSKESDKTHPSASPQLFPCEDRTRVLG